MQPLTPHRLTPQRLTTLLLGVALVAAGCGSGTETAGSTTTATPVETTTASSTQPSTSEPSTTQPSTTTTSTTVPQVAGRLTPNQAGPPPVDLIVATVDGVFTVTGDQVARQIEGSVVLAVDDLNGGVVFQVAAGRGGAYESDGLATRVWWVPAGAAAAQELLVPAPDQALTLHDVVRYAGSPTVYYTRSEGFDPEEYFDRLRRFDFASENVTDLGVVGAWESGSYPSIGGDLIALDWYAEASQGISFLSAVDGSVVDVPSNPAPDFDECCNRPQKIDLDPEGARFVYLEKLEDAQGFFVVPDIVVTEVAPGDELFRSELDRPDQGWNPVSLDFAGDYVVVNRSRSGSVYDTEVLISAWIIELSTGRVWESPVAGRARLLRSTVDISSPVPSP